MTASKKPDLTVYAVSEYKVRTTGEVKKFFTKVGSGYTNGTNGAWISIVDGVALSGKSIYIAPRKEKLQGEPEGDEGGE